MMQNLFYLKLFINFITYKVKYITIVIKSLCVDCCCTLQLYDVNFVNLQTNTGI